MDIRFGILGCGRISKNHVDALKSNISQAALIAVCDLDEEKAELRAMQYDTAGLKPVVYTDYIEMLEKENLDAVAICTESGYHAPHAIDCLNHGLHVLVEKPMALTINDAEMMITLANERSLKLGVCHQNRFNPSIQKLRRALEEGRFGKLVNGTARILWTRDIDYYKQAPWRGTWGLDGGTLMNQCIHNIDLLQWMMGGEVQSVYGQTGTFLRDIEAEDFGAIIIRFKNGSIGIVEGSVCVYPKNLEETLSIFGEKGTVVIGGLAVNKIQTWSFSDVRDYDNDSIDNSIEINNVYGTGHTPLYVDFIDAINNNRKPYISGEDGKIALNIVLKVYEQEGHSCKQA